MKINLKRILKAFRKLLATGAVAAVTFAGGESTSRAALVLSNGSFESPSLGSSYNYDSVGTGWNSHNLGPGLGYGDHQTGNNGNLVQYPATYVTTGGMSTGSQYAAAVLWDTPANVFSGSVGSAPTGMYVDQTIGTINPSDSAAQYTLSADLIRIVDAYGYVGPPSTVAGAGITIGFLNADTGAILAQTPISYTTGYAAGDPTPVKITSSISWSPASSGVASGTTVNAFIGFRLDPNYNANYLNSVAVDNMVLTSNLSTLTWTAGDGTNPTQWSTIPGVINWSSGGGPTAYTEGAYVTFDDSVGFGSTIVDISAADVFPSSVVFNNSAANYTLQGSHGIAGSATLNVAGGGNVTVNNSNSFTGATTISGGALILGNANAVINSTVSVGVDDGILFASGITAPTIGGLRGSGFFGLTDADSNPVNLTVGNNNSSTTYSGGMSDTGSLTKVGSGMLTLTGPNNYAGTTMVSGGTLQLSRGDYIVGSLGLGPVVNNAALVLSFTNHAVPIPGAISGSGSVVQQGSSVTSIGQPYANLSALPSINTSTPYHTTYSPGNTGVVTNDSAWAPVILPAGNGGQPVGALFMVRSNSQSGAYVEPTNTDRTSPVEYAGPGVTAFFRWNGTVWNYLGVGLLGANSQPAVSNTYTGPTMVSGGTLALLTPNSLSPTASTTIAAGATLDLGVGDQAVGSLIGAGTVNNMSFNLTVGGDNSKQTFSGVIQGSGGLIMTGTGSLTLTGTDTYTGGTWVNGGKLIIANPAAIASGSNLYVGDPGLLSLLPDAVVPSSAAAVTAVPEPGTLFLLAAVAAIAATRKLHRRSIS